MGTLKAIISCSEMEQYVAPWLEHSFMVRWVIGKITHGGTIELFLFQPVLHDWCNKDLGI